jgi:hypothetical protein
VRDLAKIDRVFNLNLSLEAKMDEKQNISEPAADFRGKSLLMSSAPLPTAGTHYSLAQSDGTDGDGNDGTDGDSAPGDTDGTDGDGTDGTD